MSGRRLLLVGRLLDDGALRRENHPRNGRRVDDRRTRHLDRIHDTVGEQVAVGQSRGVEAVALVECRDLADHDGSVDARVGGDPEQRRVQCSTYDCDTGCFVARQAQVVLERQCGLCQCRTASGDDALFDSSLGCVHGIVDAELAFLELGLGCRSDLDDSNSAGQLCQTLFELLAVPLGIGRFDFATQLGDAGVDVRLRACAVDDRRVVLGDDHSASRSEQFEAGFLQAEADIGGDDRTCRHDSQVVEERLAAVTEERRLDCHCLDCLADRVHDERGQNFALGVLGDDQQRLAALGNLLQQR